MIASIDFYSTISERYLGFERSFSNWYCSELEWPHTTTKNPYDSMIRRPVLPFNDFFEYFQ